MPTPFAILQQRINDAGISHLANHSFLINGNIVDGVFNNEYVTVGMVESQSPVFECRESDIGVVTNGMVISSGVMQYKVRGLQPNGSGMTKLILEKQ